VVQSIVISISVCLSVHISKTTYPNFTKFSIHYSWPQSMLCTSSFVDDVTMTHMAHGAGNINMEAKLQHAIKFSN